MFKRKEFLGVAVFFLSFSDGLGWYTSKPQKFNRREDVLCDDVRYKGGFACARTFSPFRNILQIKSVLCSQNNWRIN